MSAALPAHVGSELSVIIPTVAGREALLQRCQEAYAELTPVPPEFLVLSGFDTCGAAWVEGARLAAGRLLHFSADDLEPMGRYWYPAGAGACSEGRYLPTGLVAEPLTNTTYGTSADFARVPMLSAELWRWLEAEAPECIEALAGLHWYSDIYLTAVLDHRGVFAKQVRGYDFIHARSEVGRRSDRQAAQDRERYDRAPR